jgi:two-component system, OmpR family, sensor kinase
MSSRASEAPSLSRRLLWLVLAAIAVASVVQAVTVYRFALREADRMFDYHLQEVARSIRSGMPFAPLGDDSEFGVQIWGPDGTELYRSSPRLPPQAVLGFSDATINGMRLRIYTLQTATQVVQIAQDLGARERRAREIAARAVMPVLMVAPLLMLLAAALIASTLRPLTRIRRQVATRQPADLSPIAQDDAPAEVQPLLAELNALFGRVRETLRAQQQFVADAAHELRSPLTALKLQVQAVQRNAGRDEPALAELAQGIERSIALVEQLLALARAEAKGESPTLEPVDLEPLVRDVVSGAFAAAQARQQEIEFASEGKVVVQAERDGVALILRNLLDNAIKYAPTGGRIAIRVERTPQGAQVCVEDSGPGIAAVERERVFDRFYRAGGGDAAGSGLGLAIVKAVAERLGTRVELGHSERLGGLQASFTLRLA